MSDPAKDDASAGQGASPFRWNTHGVFVVGLLGLSLWLQIAFPGLTADVAAASGRARLVLIYFAPLAVLLGALLTRQAALALLAFPVALLPGLAALPSVERSALLTMGAMFRICATTTVFLAVTSAWLASATASQLVPTPVKNKSTRGKFYRRYVFTRTVPMLLVFIVPAGAVLFDPAVVSTIAQSYPDDGAVAQTFVVLLTLFFWAVVAYTQFLVPALNLEYDRRRERRRIDDVRNPAVTKTRMLRLGVELGIVWTLVGGTLLLAV